MGFIRGIDSGAISADRIPELMKGADSPLISKFEELCDKFLYPEKRESIFNKD